MKPCIWWGNNFKSSETSSYCCLVQPELAGESMLFCSNFLALKGINFSSTIEQWQNLPAIFRKWHSVKFWLKHDLLVVETVSRHLWSGLGSLFLVQNWILFVLIPILTCLGESTSSQIIPNGANKCLLHSSLPILPTTISNSWHPLSKPS